MGKSCVGRSARHSPATAAEPSPKIGTASCCPAVGRRCSRSITFFPPAASFVLSNFLTPRRPGGQGQLTNVPHLSAGKTIQKKGELFDLRVPSTTGALARWLLSRV